MRDLASPDRSLDGLRPGGWLHFDVSVACAGNILTSALLDLGVVERVVREALLNAGLQKVSPRSIRALRGGVSGIHLDYLDDEGRPLEDERAPRAFGANTRVHRRASPHTLTRSTQEKRISQSVSDDKEARAHASEAALKKSPVDAWLKDQPATLEALEAFTKNMKLAPVLKARVCKTIKILFSALRATKQTPEIRIRGKEAIDVLVDVVAFHAALEALSPARVSASSVALSEAPVREAHHVYQDEGALTPGPSTWVMHILADVPTRFIEADYAPTTATGAALLKSVVHLFAPPPQMRKTSIGIGLGTKAVKGRANIARAFYGEGEIEDTQTGARVQKRGAIVEARFTRRQKKTRFDEFLRGHHAQLLGEGGESLRFFVPENEVQLAINALHRLGAIEVIESAARSSALVPHLEHVLLDEAKGYRAALKVIEFEETLVAVEVSSHDLDVLTQRFGRDLTYWAHSIEARWRRLRGEG